MTRDYDYRAALYRALNATLNCVMFRQWPASNSENSHRNAEKKFIYSDKKGIHFVFCSAMSTFIVI